MFKQIADDQKKAQAQRKARLKDLETEIVEQTLPAVNNAVFAEINSNSDKIVANQREIDRKCRAVRDKWQEFGNELGKWANIIGELNKALTEVDGIQQWAESIQSQVQGIVEKLELQN